jgi:sulfur carrier protein ThiS
MGAFADLLKQHNISSPQLVAKSNEVEALQPEDFVLKTKRADKRSNTPDQTYEKLGVAKPRTGRGITAKQVAAASEDKPIPRRARAKALRAINAMLKAKGKDAVDVKAAFAKVESRRGKSKGKK